MLTATSSHPSGSQGPEAALSVVEKGLQRFNEAAFAGYGDH